MGTLTVKATAEVVSFLKILSDNTVLKISYHNSFPVRQYHDSKYYYITNKQLEF